MVYLFAYLKFPFEEMNVEYPGGYTQIYKYEEAVCNCVHIVKTGQNHLDKFVINNVER